MTKKRIFLSLTAILLVTVLLAGIVAAVVGKNTTAILNNIAGGDDYSSELDLNGDGVVNVLDAILSIKQENDDPVPQRNSLIYNKDGSFGGSLAVSQYGQGAPLNGKYDVLNSDYYTVNNDWYNMTSTEERIIFPEFKSYQQTMQDTSGIACLMMILNYMGEDVLNEYTELELVKLYEEVNETTVYGNGTTEEGLIKLIEALDLGYTTDNTSIDFSAAGNTNLATLYGATKSMCVDSIKEGKFVLVRYQSPNGYGWKLVAGYDTLGKVKSNVTGEESDPFGNDVIIFADPNDGFDHLQDGFNTERAVDFIVWFRNLDFNTGTQHDKYSYIIIDPNLDIEFEYEPVDTTVKQTLYDIHLPLNPDGTYGGTRDSALYGTISSGNGWWNQTHTNYYKINDFYNMDSEGSRILLPNYTILQQTMASSCGICAVGSILKYYGYDESYYDLELSYLNSYESVTGETVKGKGSDPIGHQSTLEQLGYRAKGSYSARYETPEFTSYESYMAFLRSNLSAGRPIAVSTAMGSGHFITVIGLDDMGTDYIYDDVIICADPCDYWDSYQDGYNTYSAYKFYTQHSNMSLNKFHSYVVVFDNNFEQDEAFSVSETLTKAKTGELTGLKVLVEGLFAGVSDEGSGAPQEIILKDKDSDKLIAVQGVTYGKFPDYGYEKGDLVQLYGTVVCENFTDNGQNKIYLEFANNNPSDISKTIISRNNEMNYTFEDATHITSWTEMKSFFNAETMEPYTYVRLTGDFWCNSYAKAGDGVPVYRLTMNGSATSAAKMAPDGARNVTFRKSMIDANVPTALTSYFEKIVMNASSPGGLSNKDDWKDSLDFYAVVTTVNSSYFYITILDSDWLMGSDKTIEIKDDFDIVEEVAYAYFRQGTQLLYDQNRYRSENWSPEQATKQQIFYTDCSSFVNNVYYEAFGVNILGVPLQEKSCNTANYTAYAKENIGVKADVIGYWMATDYTTSEEKTAALTEIYNSLQPGDILTYRHGGTSEASGHSMLYMGNGLFLHSTGKSETPNSTTPTSAYNKDRCDFNEKVQGSVQRLFAYELFENTSSSRYLMKNDSSDVIRSISIIRPLANNLTPTEKTVNRMKIAGLNVDKTVHPGLSVSVVPGGEITYKVSIQNHSANSYTDVEFKDILSNNLTFVSSNKNLTVNGQTVSMKFNIGPLETIDIIWTAKVNENTPTGALIESKNTTVGGMTIFETVNTVGSFTDEQLKAVADKAIEYATAAKTYSDPLTLAKAIHKDALGIDIFGVGSSAALFNELFLENGTIFSLNKEGALAEMVVPRLYNCTKISSYDDVVPIYFEHNFMPGDLIFCNWESNYRLFIYVGNGQLVTVDNTATTATLVENGAEGHIFVSGSTHIYRLDTVLAKVRAYEKAVVLRPSISSSLLNPVDDTMSVSEVLSGTSTGDLAGKLVTVEGLFAGVSDEGAGYTKEMILKDVNSDKLIAVQGIPYGTHPDYGYAKGDLVQLCGRVVERNFSAGDRETKVFLQFAEGYNPDNISDTIVSSGNAITYSFNNVTTIESWDDMKALFNPNTLEAYTYVRFKGDMWFNTYTPSSENISILRFHMNSAASSLSTMKPDGTRALGMRENMLAANAPDAWTKYFKDVVDKTGYPGTKGTFDFYAVVTSTNGVNYQITILENDWLLEYSE